MGVSVTFENNQAVVSVAINASDITDPRVAMIAAQALIDAAIMAGVKTDEELQAEVEAEFAKRTAARANVVGLEEHATAILAAREVNEKK